MLSTVFSSIQIRKVKRRRHRKKIQKEGDREKERDREKEGDRKKREIV